MLKKLFPFLFKDKKKPEEKQKSGPGSSEPRKDHRSSKPRNQGGKKGPKSGQGRDKGGQNRGNDGRGEGNRPKGNKKYGLWAMNISHEGLEEGVKVHIRQIYDNGSRFRVRGPGKEGNPISIVVSRKHLQDFAYESVPGRLRRYYKPHSLFNSEEEAKEAINNFNGPQ